jgi:RNA polymerase sigma factor (sigma-70 family)
MNARTLPSPEFSEAASLVAPLRPALMRFFLRKCGSAAEAEDLVQDVLVRALGRSDWESAEQAKGYIFRIAINRWHDRNRRLMTHGTVVEWDDSASFASSEATSLEHAFEQHQELDFVVAALQELNIRTLDVFMLARLEHMKQGEIAQMLGISISAVEKHIAKALAHLARRAARHACE